MKLALKYIFLLTFSVLYDDSAAMTSFSLGVRNRSKKTVLSEKLIVSFEVKARYRLIRGEALLR